MAASIACTLAATAVVAEAFSGRKAFAGGMGRCDIAGVNGMNAVIGFLAAPGGMRSAHDGAQFHTHAFGDLAPANSVSLLRQQPAQCGREL